MRSIQPKIPGIGGGNSNVTEILVTKFSKIWAPQFSSFTEIIHSEVNQTIYDVYWSTPFQFSHLHEQISLKSTCLLIEVTLNMLFLYCERFLGDWLFRLNTFMIKKQTNKQKQEFVKNRKVPGGLIQAYQKFKRDFQQFNPLWLQHPFEKTPVTRYFSASYWNKIKKITWKEKSVAKINKRVAGSWKEHSVLWTKKYFNDLSIYSSWLFKKLIKWLNQAITSDHVIWQEKRGKSAAEPSGAACS